MKRIMLDTSAIKGVAKDAFLAVRDEFEFMITDNTFLELYTHDASKGYDLSAHSAFAAKWLSMIAPLVRMVQFNEDPSRFEIEHGISAKTAPVRVFPKSIPAPHPQLQVTEFQKMLSVEEDAKSAFEFDYHKWPHDMLGQLRQISTDAKLWPQIAGFLSEPQAMRRIQGESIASCYQVARRLNWRMSTNFCPQLDWITFGWRHVRSACVLWKYLKFGAGTVLANYHYDTCYVAQMAVCDGILSNDRRFVLPLAWACWPDKRDHIYSYDSPACSIIRYVPPWETIGQ